MPKKVVFGEDGIQVEEIGGPSATVLEVAYDEPNDRVTMEMKSMAGATFLTCAETAIGERVQISQIQIGPEMKNIRMVVPPAPPAPHIEPAVIGDYHVLLDGSAAAVTLDITPLMAPGNTVVVTVPDPLSNPVDVLGGPGVVYPGLVGPPAPNFVFTVPYETRTFRFDPTMGMWVAW